jgi:hypothetical protein
VPAGSAVAAREALLAEVDAQLRADYVKEQVAGLCDLQKALTSGAKHYFGRYHEHRRGAYVTTS